MVETLVTLYDAVAELNAYAAENAALRREAFQAAQVRYAVMDEPDTGCPVCGKRGSRLLCPERFAESLPAFYLCECGYVGQVGVGPVAEIPSTDLDNE